MNERPTIIPLGKKQKDAILDDLEKRNATFFTWEKLQHLIKLFGPNAKVLDVQGALKKQKKEVKF